MNIWIYEGRREIRRCFWATLKRVPLTRRIDGWVFSRWMRTLPPKRHTRELRKIAWRNMARFFEKNIDLAIYFHMRGAGLELLEEPPAGMTEKTITDATRLQGRLQGRLDDIAGDAAGPAYYLHDTEDRENFGGEAVKLHVYDGADLCGDCADAVTALIHRLGEDEIDRVDCGGGPFESDTTRGCHWCGALIEYSLTDSGAAQEMDHFDQYPPDAPIAPGEAYALAQVLDNGSAAPDFVAKVETWLAAHDAAAEETGNA